MKIKSALPLLGILLSLSLAQAADPAPKAGGDSARKADRQAVDTACTGDAATAGCGTETVGKGLLKCIHAYKKANKDFKVSDGCKAAMKQLHGDKKAGK